MKYSIVLTVHNKEFLIDRVIKSIVNNTVDDYEIIFIVDGCNDKSREIIAQNIIDFPLMKFYLKTTPNLFETRANNIGLRYASGKYCIIVQDDMIINERGWNERLSKPCESFSDIFAVTARTAHNWKINPSSQHIKEGWFRDSGWCDILNHTDHVSGSQIARNKFSVRRSVNRGPLLLRKDILEKLNYLDESYTPQDMDDHDLCYKAYQELGMKCGVFNIDFESRDEWGGTRINGQPKPWLFFAHHKNTRLFYSKYKNLMELTYDEDRTIND